LGRIRPEDCNENQITKNDKILPFEEEAYLKGNIAFRSWTETYKDKMG